MKGPFLTKSVRKGPFITPGYATLAGAAARCPYGQPPAHGRTPVRWCRGGDRARRLPSMGATATLSEAGLVAEPGQETTCSVTIRNAGQVVDQFAIDVVGDASGWATAEPATVNLMPGETGTVTVRFAPPRSSDVPAGLIPFGVRVFSSEDPAGSVVEEGTVQLGAFTEVTAEIVPSKVEASS